MIVYKITNLLNNKIYVGTTIRSLEIRWKCHWYDKHVLGQEIQSVGIENFIIEEIYKANSQEDMYEKEKQFIQELKSYEPFGYNKFLGGKKGYKKTKEAWKRHSDSQKRRFARDGASRLGTVGNLNPRSKPIRCVETGKVFESTRQAAIILGISSRSLITRVLKGKRKSTKGYSFEYVDRSFAVGEGT